MLKTERRKQKIQRYKARKFKRIYNFEYGKLLGRYWSLYIEDLKKSSIIRTLEDTIRKLRYTVNDLESELRKNPNLSRILHMLSVYKNRQTGQTTFFMENASENDLLIVRSRDEVRRLENITERQNKRRNILSIDSELHRFNVRHWDRIFWDIS